MVISRSTPIGILGAGGIGLLQAYLFREAAVPFVLLSRAGRHNTFQTVPTAPADDRASSSSVIKLRSESVDHLMSCPLLSRILVTTKQYHNADALRSILPFTQPDATFVFLQNGIDDQPARLLLPRQTALYGITTHAVARDKLSGVATWHAKGLTQFGLPNTLFAQLKEKEGLTPFDWLAVLGSLQRETPEFESQRWKKCALNACLNPVTALFKCRNGDIEHIPAAREMALRLADELIVLVASTHATIRWPQLREDVLALARLTAGNTSSMLSDRLADQMTEIDAINGFWARYAAQHKAAVPTHSLVLDLVKARKWIVS